MSGKMSSKTSTRRLSRIELCRTRVRALARRQARKLAATNWASDRESLFPQLHYMFLAFVLISGATWTAQTQTTAAERSATAVSATDQPALPKRLPLIAPDYAAPEKALPSLERVGVNDGDALPLSLNEAIGLALENNNDIRASRIDVEMAEHDLCWSECVRFRKQLN